uniref:Uncharacterized protein n=1 Tax=Anopheles funestus TaxID=62324 RepID=A0A4Y0BIE1_ANOFN
MKLVPDCECHAIRKATLLFSCTIPPSLHLVAYGNEKPIVNSHCQSKKNSMNRTEILHGMIANRYTLHR